jgi:aminoglycoside phosphotransferase (APT) family kinase protein
VSGNSDPALDTARVTDRTPWRADHRLDAAAVTALVTAQFPELAPVVVEPLGEGWDGVVFLVNGTWAFRFPKRAEVEAGHDRERALLAALAPRLPLAVPEAQYLGAPSAAFPLRFSGYRLLAGVTADVAPQPGDVAEVGREFGRFLRAVHDFPADQVRRLGFWEWRDERWARNRAAARDALPATALAVDAQFARRCGSVLDEDALVPDDDRGPPRLIHGDLGAEHIVVVPDGSRVVGAIDWADAALGDPAADFIGLWQWGGSALTGEAASSHGDLDDGVVARARYFGFLVSLNGLRYGVEDARPAYVTGGVRSLTRGLAEFGR